MVVKIKTHDDSVTVIFYTYRNDAQVPSLYNVEPNSKIEKPNIIPIRPGYEFDGWYKDIQKLNHGILMLILLGKVQ